MKAQTAFTLVGAAMLAACAAPNPERTAYDAETIRMIESMDSQQFITEQRIAAAISSWCPQADLWNVISQDIRDRKWDEYRAERLQPDGTIVVVVDDPEIMEEFATKYGLAQNDLRDRACPVARQEMNDGTFIGRLLIWRSLFG